jgi:thiamine kinase-like enzyme
MRLTEKNIHHYLLDKGFLNPKKLIEGDYTLESYRSRNSIFKVYQKTGSSLFVKQLTESTPQNAYLMQKEATAHYLIQHTDFYKNTRKFTSGLKGYDPSNQVIVTQLFPFAKDLFEVILENKGFSILHAQKIAEILHSFHQPIEEILKSNSSLQFFNKQLPWILTIGDPQFSANNAKNSVISKILSYPDFVDNIGRLRSEWKSTSLIHGDIKWMNFVSTTEDELKLIDWEIANIGDPLWDVAGLLQSYLSSWIFSYDNNNLQHQKREEESYISIPSMQKGIQNFWKEYVQLQNYSEEEASIALNTSTRMAAARLLQTAFEANTQGPKLFPNTVRAIQLSQNIFNHPEQMISELFGLRTPSYGNATK